MDAEAIALDIIESYRLAMEAEGISPQTINIVEITVKDAISNNMF
ncbi:hypothetical protein PBI_GRAYSON_267 [Rhodococcus phage Grayson]|nr:hypothetical protein PBI_GRAYSON_267 [Rhodococcus phage Grayson]